MERHDIKIHRFKYLERIQKNREGDDKLDVVYLDETYIHGLCSVNKCWQNKDIAGPSKSISAGPRWIIVHAGGENGFVPNCCLVYRSKSTSADYHHNMNKDNFTKWVTEKLIPNLTKPSLIVMDNAKYHSVQLNKPTTQADRIAVIKEWLQSNNIPYDDNWRKCQLLEAVKIHKSEPKYQIDGILKSHGHEVLRLPPYHCTFNPIELIWGIMKQKDAGKNVNRPASDINSLTEEAFSQIGIDKWRKSCEHVIKIENQFIEQDRLIEMQVYHKYCVFLVFLFR
ncbi:uncharacterized protein LOC128200194 [Galleria mellonella]|uniref:Uncharacterized protein LOC128200194 n=1 Tax=Galleria mellonella TaxID=7137 RepID=A0ABM3MBC5_GALME|nr:uncharacterized protein LOC128200194 [Galleria mellonella]